MNLKFISTALLVLGIGSLKAQVQVGPEIGYTRTTMIQRVNNLEYNNDWNGGGKVGVVLDFPINGRFFMQTGLAFNFLHGGKSSYTGYYSVGTGMPGSMKDLRTYKLYWFHLAVLFTYKTDFQYHPHDLTFGIGPYISYNFGGLYKQEFSTTLNGTERPVYYDREMHIGSTRTQDDIKAFEIGVMAAVGYEMSSGGNFKLFKGLG